MTSVYDINEKMKIIAPPELSESWDNDGVMFCNDMNTEVKGILICLDVTKKAIEKAKVVGANLIITHHPMIFRPLKNITGASYEKIKLLMEYGISVLSFHTRLDSAEKGVNTALADALCLCDVSPYGGQSGVCGRTGNLKEETDIESFVSIIKESLGVKSVRVGLCEKKKIKKVALVGGAGKDFIGEAQKLGCDAFITGEVPHNVFMESEERNMYIIEAGHYFTENKICESLKNTLCKLFPETPFTVLNNGSPYTEM